MFAKSSFQQALEKASRFLFYLRGTMLWGAYFFFFYKNFILVEIETKGPCLQQKIDTKQQNTIYRKRASLSVTFQSKYP